MINLNDLIGGKVILHPKIKFSPQDKDGPYLVTLHGVEMGGIWIEHPTLAGIVAASVGKKPEDLPKDAVFFFPYSEIKYVVSFSTRLDLASLGL
jgi:hypothetical protein